MPEEAKVYVGDSVYARWDGYDLVLTTENGDEDDPHDRIVLGEHEWKVLVEFMKDKK